MAGAMFSDDLDWPTGLFHIMDSYKTISKESEGTFRDRSSKFICYARPVYDQAEFKSWLNQIKKEHFKARHHVPAYRIGLIDVEERSSDDGEPSGSSGLPVLNQIKSNDLINVGLVVVRYFGGTKLGVSGLINAYKSAAALALDQATIITKEVRVFYQITFDYSLMSEVMQLLKEDYLICTKKDLGVKGKAEIGFLPSEENDGLIKLTAALNHLPIESVEEIIYSTDQYHLERIGIR